MDPEHSEVREPKPEEIRQQIDETRTALTEKLETLENEVLGTVHNVTDTVEQTIENVKETVEDTVETVKRTFDLRHQVEEHPWAMLGASFLTGCLTGTLVEGLRRGNPRGWAPAAESRSTLASAPPQPARSESHAPTATKRSSVLTDLMHRFDQEIAEVKELAVKTAVDLFHDFMVQSLSNLRGSLAPQGNGTTTTPGSRPSPDPGAQPGATRYAAATTNPPW
jgi:ElaB/YqjD/DUF883 family membrane-anchored ribosome-binding protein